MKSVLSLSVCVLTLGACRLALAQTAPATAAAGADDANGALQEVVVTAERRSTNLQTTAVSATVLTAADLAAKGVNLVDQLQFIAPSVTIDNFGQGIDFDVRGIGKGEHNTQTPTGVITYRDGAATFPGYMTEEPYFDVADVELYRGPQGTLVGQNATGGAVFVTTNNPKIDGGYDGYAQLQYGNYNDRSFQGAVNLPITSTLAARVALFGDARNSFYNISDRDPADACPNNRYSGCQTDYNPGDLRWGAARVSVLWQPVQALQVLFKIDADYLDNGAYPSDPYTDRFPLGAPTAAGVPNPRTSDLFDITANAPQRGLDRFTRSILKVDYTFADEIKLQSVTSYQFGQTDYTADLDGTDSGSAAYAGVPAGYTFYDRVGETIYSEELNLISPDNKPVTWVVGAYAQSDLYDWLSPYQFWIAVGPHFPNPIPSASNFYQPYSYELGGDTPNEAYAAFASATADIVQGFSVTLGARYSYNKSRNNVQVWQYGTFITDQQKTSSDKTSYKASLNWKIDEHNFLYALVSTGYKPGGLNVPVGLGQPAPFGPEIVTSYETGYKATWLDGHVRTTVDAYYNNYDNFQVSIGYPLYPTFAFEVNDPNTTKIYGFEAETEASLGDLSLNAGVGILHSALGTFYATDPRLTTTTGCDTAAGPAGPTCIDLNGHQQTYAPNVTFNLGAQYLIRLGGQDTVTPRLNFAYESPQWATLFENPALGDRLVARRLLGAQLEWKHGPWVGTLYGSNLLNEHYVAAMNSDLDFAGPPRQYGVRVYLAF
ncbi:MAG TPA: TonB-dependent receptor [Steroidobacteraceae bacterium]|nr:TonB-dependent receptor [Steroidobacteraceae bacterium]